MHCTNTLNMDFLSSHHWLHLLFYCQSTLLVSQHHIGLLLEVSLSVYLGQAQCSEPWGRETLFLAIRPRLKNRASVQMVSDKSCNAHDAHLCGMTAQLPHSTENILTKSGARNTSGRILSCSSDQSECMKLSGLRVHTDTCGFCADGSFKYTK